MLTRQLLGVVVEKREKIFEDGTKGYFIQVLTEDDKIVGFWAPGTTAEGIKVEDVEKFDIEKTRVFVLRRREFSGQEKLSLIRME